MPETQTTAGPIRPAHALLTAALAALLLVPIAACGGTTPTDSGEATPDTSGTGAPPADTTSTGSDIPALGDSATLDIGSWNLDWFGSPDFDPADDSLQLAHVEKAIRALNLDVWGLVEVVAGDRFHALVDSLPGYAGVLASDPQVPGGTASYYAYEQKPALVYRTAAIMLDSIRLALTADDHDFAGRPPLEAHLRVTTGGVTESFIVLVVHMKAGSSADDRARREAAAADLKSYLDTRYPDERVLVIGDFNDDVDTSIAGGASPYAAFVADSAEWRFPTGALSAAGTSSMAHYSDMVDHHLWSNEAWAGYVAGSARVVRLDSCFDAYDATTSDHFPVVTRYRPGS